MSALEEKVRPISAQPLFAVARLPGAFVFNSAAVLPVCPDHHRVEDVWCELKKISLLFVNPRHLRAGDRLPTPEPCLLRRGAAGWGDSTPAPATSPTLSPSVRSPSRPWPRAGAFRANLR
jgi:hypothetical protein